MSTALVDAAMIYAQDHSWPVFPLAAKGKVPLTEHGFKDATTDTDRIRELWDKRPDSNIGIPTGAGTFDVLDVDDRALLKELQQRYGSIPATPAQWTGRGAHVLFRPTGLKNTAGQIGKGLDTRGDGGYIVVPPSIHPNGQRYRWVDGRGLNIPLADPPDWMRPAPAPKTPSERQPLKPEHWKEVAAQGLIEGNRNQGMAQLAGHLLRKGVDEHVALELLLSWNRDKCRPPLADSEVVRIVASIATAEMKRRGING